jgi:hypothetical protein
MLHRLSRNALRIWSSQFEQAPKGEIHAEEDTHASIAHETETPLSRCPSLNRMATVRIALTVFLPDSEQLTREASVKDKHDPPK